MLTFKFSKLIIGVIVAIHWWNFIPDMFAVVIFVSPQKLKSVFILIILETPIISLRIFCSSKLIHGANCVIKEMSYISMDLQVNFWTATRFLTHVKSNKSKFPLTLIVWSFLGNFRLPKIQNHVTSKLSSCTIFRKISSFIQRQDGGGISSECFRSGLIRKCLTSPAIKSMNRENFFMLHRSLGIYWINRCENCLFIFIRLLLANVVYKGPNLE